MCVWIYVVAVLFLNDQSTCLHSFVYVVLNVIASFIYHHQQQHAGHHLASCIDMIILICTGRRLSFRSSNLLAIKWLIHVSARELFAVRHGYQTDCREHHYHYHHDQHHPSVRHAHEWSFLPHHVSMLPYLLLIIIIKSSAHDYLHS